MEFYGIAIIAWRGSYSELNSLSLGGHREVPSSPNGELIDIIFLLGGNLDPQNSEFQFQFVTSKKHFFAEIRTWCVFISFPFHSSH